MSLREITIHDVRAVCMLDVGPGQDELVAPNAVSIAQAHFSPEAWFRAIYADATPIGFAMIEDHSQVLDKEPELHAGERYIAPWRFMIDHRYQELGFGAQAIRLLIAHARSRPAAKKCCCHSCQKIIILKRFISALALCAQAKSMTVRSSCV